MSIRLAIHANGSFDIIIGTDIISQYGLRVAKGGSTFILDGIASRTLEKLKIPINLNPKRLANSAPLIM